MPDKLSQNTIDDIIYRYKNGETYDEIISALKISEWTVKKHVNEARKKGIIDSYDRKSINYACLGEVTRRIKNGDSPESVAADMGMSLDKLNYIIHSGKKNLEGRGYTTFVSKDQMSEINSVIELHLKSFNVNDISTATGIDKSIVESCINKYSTLKSNIFNRPSKKRVLTPEMLDEAVLMHVNNSTIRAIGDKLHIKYDSISGYLYAYDHVMTGRQVVQADSSHRAKINDAELAELYNTDASVEDMASYFEIDRRSLEIHITKLLAAGAIKPRAIKEKELDNDIMNTIVTLVKEGNSIGVINKKTGIDYAMVCEYRTKAIKRGLLKPSQGHAPVRLDQTFRKESVLEDVLELYKKKYTIPAVAKALDISVSNVEMCLSIAKHKGLVTIRGRKTEKEIIEIINLYNDGKTLSDISKTTKTSYNAVRNIVSRYKNHVYDHLFSGGYNVIKEKGE